MSHVNRLLKTVNRHLGLLNRHLASFINGFIKTSGCANRQSWHTRPPVGEDVENVYSGFLSSASKQEFLLMNSGTMSFMMATIFIGS